jgi:hypothetical protein
MLPINDGITANVFRMIDNLAVRVVIPEFDDIASKQTEIPSPGKPVLSLLLRPTLARRRHYYHAKGS